LRQDSIAELLVSHLTAVNTFSNIPGAMYPQIASPSSQDVASSAGNPSGPIDSARVSNGEGGEAHALGEVPTGGLLPLDDIESDLSFMTVTFDSVSEANGKVCSA
jgi:hypothetical protein